MEENNIQVESYLHIDHTPHPLPKKLWTGAMNPEILHIFNELHELTLLEKRNLSHEVFSTLPKYIREKYFEAVKLLAHLSSSNPIFDFITRASSSTPFFGRKYLERVSWPWGYSIINGYLLENFDLRENLHQIYTDTTLVCGSKNKLFDPDGMRFMKKVMPNSTLIEIPSNHDLPVSSPRLFYSTFKKFLNKENLPC